MAKRLEGKVALVTGASRGIGKGIALRLAQEGAVVAIHYSTRQSLAEAVKSKIEADGGRAFLLQAEMGSVASIEAMFRTFDAELKNLGIQDGLHILVNNAGIFPFGSIEETTEELYDRVLSVNAKGPFFTSKYALTRMPAGGRIINVTSMGAHKARPQLVAYAVSKAAMDGMARSLAKHLGPRRITVNNVAPGGTETEGAAEGAKERSRANYTLGQSALGRMGKPDDIASIVAFLALEEAEWVTGVTIFASGGKEL